MRKVDWSLAACPGYDPEVFFDPDLESLALEVCASCPIRQECLIIALERPERHGVWGGRTEGERQRFKFKKTRVRCPACSSLEVDQNLGGVEVCRRCGLSWRI